MPTIRAVFFDFGGTLYDYATLEAAERESLVELVRQAGVNAAPEIVLRTQRNAMRRVFREYLPRAFYLHRDLFRDAVIAMLEELGARPDADQLDRYRAMQWERQRRDFTLREGVIDTLRALRGRGLHVGMVSNIDEDHLTHLLALARIEPYFDAIVSSERAQSCKPDLAIFQEALRRAACRPEEGLFVGDTVLQDVAGANRAGLRSVLLWHRDDRPPPNEEPRPQHVIRTIPELLGLL